MEWRTRRQGARREYRSVYSPHFAGFKDSFRSHCLMRSTIPLLAASYASRLSPSDFRLQRARDERRLRRDPALEIRPGDRDSARRADERTTENGGAMQRQYRCYINANGERIGGEMCWNFTRARTERHNVPVARRTRTERFVERETRIPLSPLFVARTASSPHHRAAKLPPTPRRAS